MILSRFFHSINNITKKHWLLVFLPLLIFVSGLMRLWRVGDFFIFGIDEEFQAEQAWALIKHFHRIWIGVSAANLNYYLGPGVTYLNWFLFKFVSHDPLALAYFASSFGIVTTLTTFFVTRILFNSKVAVISSLLYGCSALIAFYDRRFWNPSFIMITSLMFCFALTKLASNGRWLIVLGFLLGISLHIHLSLVIFWPLVLISAFKNHKILSWRIILLSFFAYFIITLPLLIFDFNHNFDNLRLPIRLLTHEGVNLVVNFVPKFEAYFSALGRIVFLRFYGTSLEGYNATADLGVTLVQGNWILALIFTIELTFLIIKKYQNTAWFILFSVIISFAYIFYPQNASEYYLLALFPVLCVLTGVILSHLPTRVWLLVLTIFIIANTGAMVTAHPDVGLSSREQLVIDTSARLNKQSYSLESFPKMQLGGWRYLFKTYSYAPVSSQSDELFGWLYTDEISHKPPKYRIIVTCSPTKDIIGYNIVFDNGQCRSFLND